MVAARGRPRWSRDGPSQAGHDDTASDARRDAGARCRRTRGPVRRPGSAVLFVLGVAALAAGVLWRRRPEPAVTPVRVPALSAEAEAGHRVFDVACARCHGQNGAGTVAGPALVDRIYRPAHHADIAFEHAVRRGVRAHHARFGDMPAQPAVTPAEVVAITRYVRELQRANGIE